MEKKKSGKGKLIIITVIIILIAAVIAGLYFYDRQNTKKMTEAMEGPALDYYDKYMSANTGASAYKVTLSMLEKANQNGENYNLSALEKCESQSTYALINIDYYNGQVTKTDVKLDCKKF